MEDDPTRPSLQAIADSGHHFSLPWSHEVKPLMLGFESRLLSKREGPWKMSNPFDIKDLSMTTIISDTTGGTASFRDGLSTTSGSVSDHFSANLTLTIGYPCLNASVSGQYDKRITENQNSIRASRNTSCRLGRVVLSKIPSLSRSAVDLLMTQGPTKFRENYGDYYICGYELGADAGACLSAWTKSSSKSESLKLTLSVKVLFVKKSISKTKTSYESHAEASMSFNGYTTLHQEMQSIESTSVSPYEQARLQKYTSAFLEKVESLDADARAVLENLGLKNGNRVPLSDSAAICKSGLVVQLLLAPYARMNQYVTIASGAPVLREEQTE